VLSPPQSSILLPAITGLLLLGVFIGVNEYRGYLHEKSLKAGPGEPPVEVLTDTAAMTSRMLSLHDFEKNLPEYQAYRIIDSGHISSRSAMLDSLAAFSPGIKMPFHVIKAPPGSWIRTTAWVRTQGEGEEPQCNLVVTCNHQGTNYKYAALRLQDLKIKPGQWERITVDYRLPEPPDSNDLLQVYLWYYGKGSLGIDDISVTLYEPVK
jgi:hypothetical protein